MLQSGIVTVKHTKIVGLWGACGLLGIFVLRLFLSAPLQSVTFDEYAHVPAGYSYWRTGNFSLYSKNPPLIKLWFTLPLIITSPQLDFDPSQRNIHPWAVGFSFLKDNLSRYHAIFLQCRAMVILLSVFLGLMLFLWTRALYGWMPALLCLFLYTFCPEILAHSQLCTTDIGGALFLISALAGLWFYLRKPTAKKSVVCGILLGGAQLAKFSNLVLYFIYPLVLIAFLRKRDLRKSILVIILIFIVSVFVINIGYFFQGTLRPLGTYTFTSNLMKSAQEALPGHLPVPFPSSFVEGFDLNRYEVEIGHLFYLNGHLSLKSRWYYFLEAFTLKTPIPFLLLIFYRAFINPSTTHPHSFSAGSIFLIASVVFLANFSFFTSLDIGVRYILPIFPLLSLWMSPVVLRMTTMWKKILFGFLLVWYAAGSLSIHPHYLSYFNEIAGGPDGGHRYLGDSNIDWGQDLPQLKKYMDAHGLSRIKLFYYGVVDPEVYGISYDFPLGEGPSSLKGDIAVSVSFLQGKGIWSVPTLKGRYLSVREGALIWLNRFQHAGRAGYSIYIFHL